MIIRTERVEQAEAVPFQGSWLLEEPWAHPIWSQYFAILVDLTTSLPGRPAPVLQQPGVTHEFLLWALDQKFPMGNLPFANQEFHHLEPPNHAYQFEAESGHDEAFNRIDQLMQRITRREINPDTDARPTWHREFADGVSLIK